MPYPFQVTITTRASSETVSHAGEFSDNEWHLLRCFLAYSDQLAETGLVRNKRQINLSIKWHSEEGELHGVVLPPDDEVSAFLHRMRPFILKKEQTYLPTVLNVLARRVPLPQGHRVIDVQRKRFLQQTRTNPVIEAADTDLTSDEMLTKWLNAFEYHHDADKQVEFELIHAAFPPASSKALFLMSLSDKAQAVFDTASLVRALKARGGASVTLPGWP